MELARGVAKGGALGARVPPRRKNVWRGLKNYSQEQKFSPLACTPLRKFLATPLLLNISIVVVFDTLVCAIVK